MRIGEMTTISLCRHVRLPAWIMRLRRNHVAAQERKRFAGLTTRQVFTAVYQEGGFGGSQFQNAALCSGSGSHQPDIVEPYVKALEQVLLSLPKKPNAVDLGCGDFAIASRLRRLCDNYIACDIVESVIKRNKQDYRDAAVDFRVLDMIEDELPDGDIVFIRQVFQHLSNRQIGTIIAKVKDKYRYLVLTEHLPGSEKFVHNLDKPVGPDIRLFLKSGGSGVVLTSPPFSLQVIEDITLCEARQFGGLIRTTLYRLK